MKKRLMVVLIGSYCAVQALAATLYVDLNCTNPTPPYNSWATAATAIQDAVDAALSNDTVLVTSGVYTSGGAVISNGGITTNRVAIPSGVTVQSVNGPAATLILGSGSMGSAATRCAYVGFDALLSGFTLTNGTTRTSGGYSSDQAAGGVWSETSGTVSNCVLIKNSAERYGGGAYGGNLVDCTLSENISNDNGGGAAEAKLTNCSLIENSVVYSGGGAYYCTLTNCELIGNSADNGGGAVDSWLDRCILKENTAIYNGGGATVGYEGGLENCALIGNSAGDQGGGYYFENGPESAAEDIQPMGATLEQGALNNCTLTGNSAGGSGGGVGGNAVLNNCIVYFNQAPEAPNYNFSSFNYSCTTPLPDEGTGNLSADPLLASASHLSTNSPCIGAGSTNDLNGADIDGETWETPPSMGCDELVLGSALGTLTVQASANYLSVTPGYAVRFTSGIAGRTTSSDWNWDDGSSATNQPYATHAFASAGTYVVELTVYNDSNPSGVSDTITIQVNNPVIHYVDLANASPAAPYTSWTTAANTIQDAIDASTQFGAHVLVAGGVYGMGGQAVAGSMTNRVVVKAGLSVLSVNGPESTWIEGVGPVGSNAVRGVYMAADSFLSGFTLTNGHTRASGDYEFEQSGGGVWCETSATLSNCVIVGNSATEYGGGAYHGTLIQCSIFDNSASYGGGVAGSTMLNSVLARNHATQSGGGSLDGTLNNCTLSGNIAEVSGGGTEDGILNNCIVYLNQAPIDPNYQWGTFTYSCATPVPDGTGNIADDPLLASVSHLSTSSPCIGAGSATYTSGTDIDGEAWANPPSMGCDEAVPGSSTGALTVLAEANHILAIPDYEIQFSSHITGKPTASEWRWDDGTVSSNQPFATHAFASTGTYGVELVVYNDSNPAGVSSTVTIQINDPIVHYVDEANPSPVAPYTSWATAATTIQDAIDAVTTLGARVRVADGVYASGGKLTIGLTTNRVAVSEGLTVQSVNGPEVTIIQGSGSNGASAVRCVYLAKNAFLSGFTLTNGATQTTGEIAPSQSGGGLWSEDSGTASNCVIIANSADNNGGGAYQGTLLDCTISGNSAYNGGGTCESSLVDCILSGNEARYGGGSYYGTLDRCTLTENHAQADGGGSYYGTLNHCIISNNQASDDSGGADHGTLNHCIISGNHAADNAGGVYSGTLDNCLVSGNRAEDDGGGSYYGTLRNCTVVSNVAGSVSGDDGGGCYSGTLINSIVYGNSAGGSGYQNYRGTSFRYSCTTPMPSSGEGNIEAVPLFVDAAASNYRLESISPCIDAGNNAEVLVETDLDGELRIRYGVVDMGAYEKKHAAYHIATSVVSLSTSAPVGASPSGDSFAVWNAGSSNLTYSITTNVAWLSCLPVSGSSTGEQDTITVSFDTAGLAEGSHTGTISIVSVEADNSPYELEVVVEIYSPMLGHFEWDAIDSPQTENSPFNVVVSAWDAHGNPFIGYTGTAALSGSASGGGTTEVAIGNGTSNWEYPMATYYEDCRSQVIYLNSEIGNSGKITSLALNVTTAPSIPMHNWTIRMRHTPLSSYAASPEWESDWTVVYQTTTNISETGWVVFIFDTPFEYNGTDNLMVDFSINHDAYGDDGECMATDTGADRSLYYQTDSDYDDPLDWLGSSNPTPDASSLVPNIKLGIQSGAPIAISPTNTSSFVDGIWNGNVTILETASNVVLHAERGGVLGNSIAFNVIAGSSEPDTDGDGIPDWWELKYFGGITNCLATDHADSDVQNNGEEYITGTDPTNGTSFFGFTNTASVASGFVLQWDPSVDGREYAVNWTNDLSGTFTSLVSGIEFPQNSYTDTLHGAEGAGFYKVEVQLK